MAQQFYKKMYSLPEGYIILYQALRTMKYMVKGKKRKEISPEFIERIMLAVTEVNGCEVCTYGHTKMALEQGMSNEEIQKLLAGVTDGIPDDEVKAVFFAQHYADTRGHPSAASWQQIVDTYGTTKALGIFGRDTRNHVRKRLWHCFERVPKSYKRKDQSKKATCCMKSA